MLRLTLVFTLILATSSCSSQTHSPDEYWQSYLFSDPQPTEEKCISRVDRKIWLWTGRPLALDLFGYEEERLQNLAEQKERGHLLCRHYYRERRIALQAEADDKYGGIRSLSDPFGLTDEASAPRERPNLSGNLTNLLPKPEARQNSREIHERRLRDYMNSPLRGSAASTVSGFDFGAPACPEGTASTIGC
jgi:hypothetical protein